MFEDIEPWEKIEAISEAKEDGTFGSYKGFGIAGCIVTLDSGERYGVWQSTNERGWCVRNCETDFHGYGETVLDAAENCVKENI